MNNLCFKCNNYSITKFCLYCEPLMCVHCKCEYKQSGHDFCTEFCRIASQQASIQNTAIKQQNTVSLTVFLSTLVIIISLAMFFWPSGQKNVTPDVPVNYNLSSKVIGPQKPIDMTAEIVNSETSSDVNSNMTVIGPQTPVNTTEEIAKPEVSANFSGPVNEPKKPVDVPIKIPEYQHGDPIPALASSNLNSVKLPAVDIDMSSTVKN